MSRDPFVLLGVAPDASDAEIAKAYRALARTLHPDRNPAPDAATRFGDVAWAFEQIGRPERRLAYLASRRSAPDAHGLGAEFASLFVDTDPEPARGDDVEYELEISLAEVRTGLTTAIAITLEAPCQLCGGSGSAPGHDPVPCRVCGGRGQHRAGRVSTPCAHCHGRGRMIGVACPDCDGEGRREREQTVLVEVPAGVVEGQTLVLTDAIDEYLGVGDLCVRIVIAPHPIFTREGEDLMVRLPVSFVEAALGLRVPVPVPDGSVRFAQLPAGSQPGDIIALEGEGVGDGAGGVGDLLVELVVQVPQRLTRADKRLIQQLQNGPVAEREQLLQLASTLVQRDPAPAVQDPGVRAAN